MTTQEFSQLALNQKRILVAQDVIAQIRAGRYLGRRGVYVKFDTDDTKFVQAGTDVKSTLNKLSQCDVCAYGAMMLSAIGFMSTSTWDAWALRDGYLAKRGSYIEPIKSLFSNDELDDIEAAFEGWGNDTFIRAYENPSDRIIAIMENIIANDGAFIYIEDTSL